MNRLPVWILLVWLMMLSLPSVLAQENGWPRTIPLEQGTVTIYAPQVDELSGGTMEFRAALAYRATADSEPVFGAGWFESKVDIDFYSRVVHPKDLIVTDTRFPDGIDDVQSALSAAMTQYSTTGNFDFSLDELEASLKTAEAESTAIESLNTAPPEIIYRDQPALLVSLDGDPVLREIENSPFEAVINTPYPLIFDGRHYYLNVAREVWYRADQATGPYQFDANPPAEIAAMVNEDEAAPAGDEATGQVTADNAPEIVVTTQPAELIVTEGPAAFVPLVDDLLVLQNSDDDVFLHVSEQEFYIVLAGRWYRGSSLDGPWSYQPADELPSAFANIPQDSNQADSRVYVAGTDEAREAVMDAQVPQATAVARGEADITVQYDGDPVFEPVDGTDLVYIRNTGSTVILSDGWYYLVEDGVWYVSSTPNGPWQVSDHRPAQVDTILPTSPVYNARYVRIYDSTPRVVYVGYTPGYTGSFVYHDTIFYGSGWTYSPWVSHHYYFPRHRTWGFNVHYNPWFGWSFGLSWGWGPFSVGFYPGGYWHRGHHWHHRHFGHWGPRGYRPRPVHHGYGRNRYASDDGRRGDRGRNDNGRDREGRDGDGRNGDGRSENLYSMGPQRAMGADSRSRTPGGREQLNDGENKAGRSRTQPVSSNDLRQKAEQRDASYRASQSRMLSRISGKDYRKVDREPERGLERNQSRDQNNARRPTQTTARVSTRPVQNRNTVNEPAQRTSRSVSTLVRQSQPATGGNSPRQRQLQSVTAPAQYSSSSRSVSTVQAPRNSSPANQAPTQRTSQRSSQRSPQRSSQRTSSRRSGSDRAGSSRSSASRPERRRD